MSEDFIGFCESVWRDWLADALDYSSFVRARFDINAAPEPYISFGAGRRPLLALTTNPGATMWHQRRAAVQLGTGPLSASADYATAARALGTFYEHRLTGPAGRRIAALRMLSDILGTDGVLQVEACPFHSPALPGKVALLGAIGEGGLLGQYVEHVRAFVRRRPVVVVSAAASRVSLQQDMHLSPWLRWQAETAGLNLDDAAFVPLIQKGAKTTCGAFVSRADGVEKALVLMMGGNNLPGRIGLETLVAAVQAAM